MSTSRRLLAPASEPYAAVCAVLWSERELLEALACTVVVGRLVGRADGALGTSAEQTALLERLRLQEVLRAAMVEAVASVTGPGGPRTLRELAEVAPEPWATMLHEHRDSLRALATDLRSLSEFGQLSLSEFID